MSIFSCFYSHFLKIVLEGFEVEALSGNDWGKNRPCIDLVEATLPMSQEQNQDQWESILVEEGSSMAYADGLNRFHVANEQIRQMDAFAFPPNVFDVVIWSETHAA